MEARFLALRAGVGGAEPQSRADAARQVGIPGKRAAKTERRGIKHLRRAARAGGCGPGSAPARIALSGDTGPQLEPAVLMGPAPELRPASDLADERSGEGQGLGGVEASSGDPTHATPLAAAPVADAVTDASPTGWYVLLALLMALTLALVLLLRRQRDDLEPVVAQAAPPPPVAPPLPTPAPLVEPDMAAKPAADTTWGGTTTTDRVSVPAAQPSRRRSAAVVAGSLASLAATALIRRRRR